jgi:hypothetical protein
MVAVGENGSHLREEGQLSSALLQLVSVTAQLRVGLLELLLEVGAGRDVDDRGDDERTAPRSHRRQADLDGELDAVAPASQQVQPTADRAWGRVNAIPGNVRRVRSPVTAATATLRPGLR